MSIDTGTILGVNTFEERIDAICKRMGISQRELARRAKLKNDTDVGVMVLRRKRDPEAKLDADALHAIARVGGVTVEWLLTGEDLPLVDPPSTAHLPSHTQGALERHPNIDALLEAAKTLEPNVTEWAWRQTLAVGPSLRGAPTARSIADLAKYIMQHESDPDLDKR